MAFPEVTKASSFKNQQQTRKVFQKGEQVEVASKEDGFFGSYYEATIISSIGNSSKYRVKYKNLLTNDESAPLVEIVNADDIRPVPPQTENIPANGFRLYEKVDVFANDGWWFGFIFDEIETEYVVFFPTTGDVIAYPPEVLRVHQEWYDGEWII